MFHLQISRNLCFYSIVHNIHCERVTEKEHKRRAKYRIALTLFRHSLASLIVGSNEQNKRNNYLHARVTRTRIASSHNALVKDTKTILITVSS